MTAILDAVLRGEPIAAATGGALVAAGAALLVVLVALPSRYEGRRRA